jgi:peptide/nickel transport system substrate-binding protein
VNQKKLVSALLAITLLAVVFVGNHTRSFAAAKKTTLVVSQTSDASILDPQKQGKMPDMNILINIFDTLVTRDAKGNLAPSLATEWKAIDNVTWQFKLRKGVKFHNGEEFDAEAVKFSIDRLLDPKTASPIAELRNVKKAVIVDKYTVNIVTNAPDPILPNKTVLFGGVVLPPKYVREKGDAYIAKHPVGTGPYKFVSWQKDNQVVLEANKSYWRGAPQFEKLIFKTIPSMADTVAALKAGEVDFTTGMTADAALSLANGSNVKVMSAPWIRTFYISLNTTVKPLNDVRVRQALNYAVNVPAIIKNILGGRAKRVATIVPSQNFGYDPAVTPYKYNPAKAKKLLAAAGYPKGFSVTFDADNLFLTEIQAIAAQLEAVGVKVNLNVMDKRTMVSKMQAKTVSEMYFIGNTGWTMDALSNFQSYVKSDRRYARLKPSKLDELVDIEETTIDPAKRKMAIVEIQKTLKEEADFIYLWQLDNICAINKKVQYTPDVIGALWMYPARCK